MHCFRFLFFSKFLLLRSFFFFSFVGTIWLKICLHNMITKLNIVYDNMDISLSSGFSAGRMINFLLKWMCTCSVAQLCPTLCAPMDSLPGSAVHGIFQARILEQLSISYSRGSSWPRNWTHVSHVSSVSWVGRQFFNTVSPGKPQK